MSVKLVLASVVVFAAGTLLMAGSASAQFGSQVKVSNVIEGSGNSAGVSAARCGPNIVVGFGDREPGPAGSGSNAGFSVSSDGGMTFSDLGALTDPSLSFGGGGGQHSPVVPVDSSLIACSSASVFYYATQGFVTDSSFCAVGCTEIAVSSSTNGGRTWNAPVAASSGTNDIYGFESPSFAADPTNPQRLYAAYINDNFGQPQDFGGCGSSGDVYILELVTSTDGGKTWSSRPNPGQNGSSAGIPQLDDTCSGPGFDSRHTGRLVAPAVLVSPGGKVYVAYEFVGLSTTSAPPPPNEIRFSRSLDNGKTFSAPITVSNDAIDNALPQLAVDRTTSAFRGTIYLTWSGKPRGTTTEVLMSDSLDQGGSFSFPRSVRATSQGTQVNPVVAVDNDGQVANCYYVTGTNTPTSSSNYFYNCLTSFNHAATWTQYQKLVTSAPPGFDALTSDFLLQNDGFFTAFEVSASGQSHVVGAKSDN
jgi:hypothetical protein